MDKRFSRTELLFGRAGMDRLAGSRVAVFGVGGVGGYAVEALARGGIGFLELVDNDRFTLSNINRQLHATEKTIGRSKVEAVRERILEINPGAAVKTRAVFYTPQTAELFDFREYDYIIDAIDTVTGKLELAVRAWEAKTPLVSSMGAGNKVDAARLEIADLYQTSVCPLAKVMRRELKKRGVPALKVVYSKEAPMRPIPFEGSQESLQEGRIPGSTSFVPAAAGLLLAGEVIKDILRI